MNNPPMMAKLSFTTSRTKYRDKIMPSGPATGGSGRAGAALLHQEMQIAQIDHAIGDVTDDEYRIGAINRISQQDQAAADTEIPECQRKYAAALTFAADPLDQPAAG